jgi:tetratricopeptide (TPR) repeat protein
MGTPRAIALCRCFEGALEFQAGHWAKAEAALRESIRLYRQIGAASGEALACQRLGVLQTARQQLEEGLATLQEGLAAAEHAVMRAHCLTRIYAAIARNRLAASDLAAADHALNLGLAMSERHGNCATCDALLLPAAVSVRVAQGDFAAARAFCSQLDRAAERYASQMWVAMALQSRAELAAAEDQDADAVMKYEEAAKAFSKAGNDYEAACCLAFAAELRIKRGESGDTEQAQAALAQAQQVMQGLGIAIPQP